MFSEFNRALAGLGSEQKTPRKDVWVLALEGIPVIENSECRVSGIGTGITIRNASIHKLKAEGPERGSLKHLPNCGGVN